MFGAPVPELLRFFIQVSAAAAGATSLWGLVFSIAGEKQVTTNKEKSEGFFGLASIMAFAFGIFFLLFLIFWFIGFMIVFPPVSLAHEGLKINPLRQFINLGFLFNSWFVMVLAVVGSVSLSLWRFKHALFRKWAPLYFLLQFSLVSVIVSFSVFSGEYFTREQIFYSFHGWHSILTLGTVLTVDILYILTLQKDNLKRVLYPFFPWISLFIWVGLGLDFLSITLVFNEAFKITPQVFLSQTVVAIIILNGVLLSERLNNFMIKLIRPGEVLPMPKHIARIASLSGAISVSSWTTITFVDFFKFSANYPTLVTYYVLFISIVFLIEPMAAKILNYMFNKISPFA